MRVILVLWLWTTLARAHDCHAWLHQFALEQGTSPFLIGLDFDSTVIDTDAFLVQRILPEAVERLFPELSLAEKEAFSRFLDSLKKQGVAALPATFEAAAWEQAPWGFPLGALPESLAARPRMRPGSTKLQGFWDLMREVFEAEDRSKIPILDVFLRFAQQIRPRFGGQVGWVVITGRHAPLVDDIEQTLAQVGIRPQAVLHRAGLRPSEGQPVADLKARQIAEHQALDGARIRIFVDNDARNLRAVQALSAGIWLIHVQTDLRGQRSFTRFAEPGANESLGNQ